MNNETRIKRLTQAAMAAEQFIAAADESIKDMMLSESEYVYCKKSYAASKRASMDLTRSLVGVRKSIYKK